MKATIRYTRIDYQSGQNIGDAIVRVTEITHCVALRGGFTLIMLTTGGSVTAAESLEEIEQRIDEAEGREIPTSA